MWESKVAPLSGIGFAVLLIVAFVLNQNTDFMPPEDQIISYFEGDPQRIMSSAYLGILAAAALLWFSGSTYKLLRRLEDDNGRLAVLAFGGGVLASAFLVLGELTTIAAAERVSVADSIGPEAAATLFDLSGVALGNGAPVGLGILIGATALAILRTGGGPTWIGWVSLAIAVGLISPVGWAVLAVALIWVPVAAVWVYRAEKDVSPDLVGTSNRI